MSNPVVAVTVTANTKPYVSAMDKAALSTTKVDKASTGMAAGMVKTAGAAAAAGVSIAAFTGIVKDSIGAASALQDSTSKMNVVFGSASASIVKFANDSTQSFGLSQRAAYDATSTFAILGKAAGLTGDELTKFSTDLTKRAVDLSSFFGGSVQDAIVAVGAALRGESEPIRAYGVLLDDATLRAAALEMGLISSVKEGLTPQTRALAAQAEVMRQSSDAAGDYNNTIDGMANSAREAAKAWEDAQAAFGTAALPIATKATQLGAGFLTNLTVGFKALPLLLDELTADLSGNEAGADAARAAMAALVTTTNALGDASSGAAGGVGALGDAAAGTAGAIGSMDAQAKAALEGLFGFIDAQQGLASSQRDMLGLEDELRNSAKQTATARTGGSRKSSDAERKAQQKVIDGIRARDAAEQEAEIKAARRKAQAKAEATADKGARRDVRGGVAGAIATDKAARAGQDIDGFNQNGSVGEATGSLSKGAQKRLDAQIDGIRARHKKALETQLKGLKEATTTARATAGAVDSYSFSLDANTEAGRRNLDTLSSQVDKVQTNAQAVYDAAILDGKGAEEAGKMARDALLAGYDAITESATNVGFATSEVEKYLKSLGLIPSKITTTYKFIVDADMSKAKAEYQKARAMFDGLGRKLKTDLSAAEQDARAAFDGLGRPMDKRTPGQRYSDAISSVGQRRAAGGEIYGPGGPRTDSVPVWASRGEFVVNASQYSANRELVKAINAGTGAVSTGGGISIGAVNVTETTPSGVRTSVIDALAEAAYRSGAVR